jgi:uncharacterized membrane protein
MKWITYTAAAAMLAFTAIASADEADLARRLQKLEQAIARMEARLAKLESSQREERRGMMGGGMMGGGMMGGGMMGGGRPNEQWRTPEAKK